MRSHGRMPSVCGISTAKSFFNVSENPRHNRGSASGLRGFFRFENGPLFGETSEPEGHREVEQQIKTGTARGGTYLHRVIVATIRPHQSRVPLPDRMYRRSHSGSLRVGPVLGNAVLKAII